MYINTCAYTRIYMCIYIDRNICMYIHVYTCMCSVIYIMGAPLLGALQGAQFYSKEHINGLPVRRLTGGVTIMVRVIAVSAKKTTIPLRSDE